MIRVQILPLAAAAPGHPDADRSQHHQNAAESCSPFDVVLGAVLAMPAEVSGHAAVQAPVDRPDKADDGGATLVPAAPAVPDQVATLSSPAAMSPFGSGPMAAPAVIRDSVGEGPACAAQRTTAGTEGTPAAALGCGPGQASGIIASPAIWRATVPGNPAPTGVRAVHPAAAEPVAPRDPLPDKIPAAPTQSEFPVQSAPAVPLPAAAAGRPTPAATPFFASSRLAPQLAGPLFSLATAAPGEHVMTLQISPEDLGPVTVRAHIDASGVRIELFAPGEAGRDALRTIMPELRRGLADTGLGANLDLSDRSSPPDTAGGEPRDRRGSREESQAPPAAAAATEALREFRHPAVVLPVSMRGRLDILA